MPDDIIPTDNLPGSDDQNPGDDDPRIDPNATSMTPYGRIMSAPIIREMQRFYLDYAMSVIVSRALPDVRDGLKPVHRRILFAMYNDLNLAQPAKHVKCAKVVGQVLANYHPHGDAPVYESLVRLAQDFSLRYPLVDGQGNFGSIDGDSAAAMRYTECRLEKISSTLINDIDKNTVPMSDNFDATAKEPNVLPALLPNLLLMGAEGIAVGMATKIPPHNLTEVTNAILTTIKKGKTSVIEADTTVVAEEDNEFINLLAESKPNVPWKTPIPNPKVGFDSNITIDELISIIPGPDFPTAGYIFDTDVIRAVYTTGRGSIPMRGKTDVEEIKGGKFQIIITELPYQVNKANLVAKIAELVKDKRIEGISDLRDESDREGIRVVVELKRDSNPKKVLNQLYKHTQLQTNFPANMVALVNGTPQLLNLKLILLEYIKHRQVVIIRRSQHDLHNARYRAHILEGLKIALDHIDEIIKTIRSSKDTETAKSNLMGKFGLTDIQAVAILDMQLRRLSGLERQKIEDEYKEVMALIDYLEGLLNNPERIADVIRDEVKKLRDDFGDERRTMVVPQPLGEFNEEDLIPNQTTIIALTDSGYVKRLDPAGFKNQRRGGKGITGMTTKEADDISHVRTASTHDFVLFFTNKGRVFKLRVYELPEGSRTAKGTSIVNLLNVGQDERVQSMLTLTPQDFLSSKFIVLGTKQGLIKKTAVTEFANIRTSGIIAINLQDKDQLIGAQLSSGKDHIFIATYQGKSIRFAEADLRATGRDTMGVIGIKRGSKEDYAVTVLVFPAEFTQPDDKRRKSYQNLLIVMEKGLGKQSPLKDFPLQSRGGQGVKVANITSKTGNLVGVHLITEEVTQLVITTKQAQIIRMLLRNIPVLSRPTQGVILMRPRPGDQVTAITTLGEEVAEEEPNLPVEQTALTE